jgi:hypothetical protein
VNGSLARPSELSLEIMVACASSKANIYSQAGLSDKHPGTPPKRSFESVEGIMHRRKEAEKIVDLEPHRQTLVISPSIVPLGYCTTSPQFR